MALTLCITMGQGPFGCGCSSGGDPMGDYASAGYGAAGYGAAGNGGSGAGQLFPFDSPEPWLHGILQRTPTYGGFRYFRPYNYKHVVPQAQASNRWGTPFTQPYSQQFWHRYQQRARMVRPRTSNLRNPSNLAAAPQVGPQQYIQRADPTPGRTAEGVVAPQILYERPKAQAIDSAGYQGGPQINQLQQQLMQLTIQQQALQNALIQAQQPRPLPNHEKVEIVTPK